MSSKKRHEAVPILGASEWSVEQGGGAYISWLEHVNIPGLESADIRFEFEKRQSLAEVKRLIAQLNALGLKFVVQK
ncbi:hypothetical protein [Luteibacter sp.]|jgi:hypothetical protein|uniref:hypothetical protein n=1 Tax=Luteibacter sp. TaxID=1886636 RepID=UPI002F41FC70